MTIRSFVTITFCGLYLAFSSYAKPAFLDDQQVSHLRLPVGRIHDHVHYTVIPATLAAVDAQSRIQAKRVALGLPSAMTLEEVDAAVHQWGISMGQAVSVAPDFSGILLNVLDGQEGDDIDTHTVLFVWTLMKMNLTKNAPFQGNIADIFFHVGDQVTENDTILTVLPSDGWQSLAGDLLGLYKSFFSTLYPLLTDSFNDRPFSMVGASTVSSQRWGTLLARIVAQNVPFNAPALELRETVVSSSKIAQGYDVIFFEMDLPLDRAEVILSTNNEAVVSHDKTPPGFSTYFSEIPQGERLPFSMQSKFVDVREVQDVYGHRPRLMGNNSHHEHVSHIKRSLMQLVKWMVLIQLWFVAAYFTARSSTPVHGRLRSIANGVIRFLEQFNRRGLTPVYR